MRISQNLNFVYCFGLNLCGQNKVPSDVTVLNVIPEHSCLSVMNGVTEEVVNLKVVVSLTNLSILKEEVAFNFSCLYFQTRNYALALI